MSLQIDGLEVLDELGRGGFGVVHRAREAALDRIVAVKVLAVSALDEQVLARFEREARVLGRLSEHPSIVTVHATGRTSDGRPWVSMAWLPNGSLADRLRRDGPLPAAEVADIGVRMAGALETAHRHGILHRDVKPENVLLTSYGRPELADFGIARMIGGTQTAAPGITASLAHAAPEVLDGGTPAPAADVYGLASTLFSLLYGRPAFDPGPDGNVSQLVVGILRNAVPDLRTAGVPDQLAAAIELGLSRDEADRPATAQEFGDILRQVQRDLDLPVTDLVVLEPTNDDEPRPVSTGPVTSDDATRHHVLTPALTSATNPAPTSPAPPAAEAPGSATPPPMGQPPTGQPTSVSGAEPPVPPGPPGGRRSVWLVAGVVILALLVVGQFATRSDRNAEPDAAATATDDQGVTTDGTDGPATDRATLEFPTGDNAGEGRVVFRTQLTDGDILAAAASDALVFVATDTALRALDTSSGAESWSLPLDGTSPVALASFDDVLVVLENGQIRGVSPSSGDTVWDATRTDDAFVALHAFDDAVIATGARVALVLSETGAVLQDLTFDGAPEVVAPDPESDLVFVLGGDSLRAISNEGSMIELPSAGAVDRLEVVADDRAIYVAAATGAGLRMGSIPRDGSQGWAKTMTGVSAAAIRMRVSDNVLVVTNGQKVAAFHATDGTPNWESPLPTGDWLSVAIAPEGIGVVADIGDTGTRLFMVGLYDGERICQAPTGDPDFRLLTGSRWIVTDSVGTIWSHDGSTCQAIWTYDLPEDANPVLTPLFTPSTGELVVVDDAHWVTLLRLWDK